MTDALVETAQLSGHVNPFGVLPSFTVPIFRTLTSNAPFVQKINADDKVFGFQTVGVETDRISFEAVPAALSPVSVGDEAIWTFQLHDGKCLVGSREQLAAPLKDFLNVYSEKNFLKYQLLRFCRLDDLAKNVLRKAYDSISEISPIGSNIWRDIEVILPAIADSIVALSREGVLDVSLLEHLQQLRIIEASKKGNISVEIPQVLHDALSKAGSQRKLINSISPYLYSFRLSEIKLVRSKEADKAKTESKSELRKVPKEPEASDIQELGATTPPLLIIGVGDFGKSACSDLWRTERNYSGKYNKVPYGWHRLVSDIQTCEFIGKDVFISRTNPDDLFGRIDSVRRQKSLFADTGPLRSPKPVVVILFGAGRSDISIASEMAASLREAGSTVVGVHISVYSQHEFILEDRLSELRDVFNGIVLIQDISERRYMGVSPRVRGLAAQAVKAIYAFTRKRPMYNRFISSIAVNGRLKFSGVFHSRGDSLDQSVMGLVDELSNGHNIRLSADKCFLLVEGMDINKSKEMSIRKALHEYGLRSQTIGLAAQYKAGFALDLTTIVSGIRSKDVRPLDTSYADFCVSIIRREGWRVTNSPPRPSRFFTAKKATKVIQFFCSSGDERQEPDIARIADHYCQRNYHPVVILGDRKVFQTSQKERRPGIFYVHHKEVGDLLRHIESTYFDIVLERSKVIAPRSLKIAYAPFVQTTMQRYLTLRGNAYLDKKLSRLSNVKLEGLSDVDFSVRQRSGYLHFMGNFQANYMSWRRDLSTAEFNYSVSFDFFLTPEGLKYNFVGTL